MHRPVHPDATDEERDQGLLDRRFSRRSLLAGAAAAGAGGVIGAMGGQAVSGAVPKSERSAKEIKEAAELDADITSFLKKQFTGGGPHSYKGKAYTTCAGLLLSTTQAPYGDTSLKGMKLAVSQIAAAGGPKITLKVSNAEASATAGTTEWTGYGEAHIPFGQSVGFFDEGNVIAPAIQYHVVTTDGGGGALPSEQGKPYIWATRALTPVTAWPGSLLYLKHVFPHAKKLGLTGSTLGALKKTFITAKPKGFIAFMNKFFPGASLVGSSYGVASTASVGVTWGPATTKAADLSADVLFGFMWGTTPASYIKDLAITGTKAQLIGADYFQSGNNLAGTAMEGYWFNGDYFNAKDPGNTWGKLFTESFVKEYGLWPNYYTANYYEQLFFCWELIQRAVEKKKTPKTGTVLNSLLEETASFKSLYGTGTVGGITITKTSHSPSKRPMGLFEVTTSSTSTAIFPKQLASYTIDGKTFKVVSKPSKFPGGLNS